MDDKIFAIITLVILLVYYYKIVKLFNEDED